MRGDIGIRGYDNLMALARPPGSLPVNERLRKSPDVREGRRAHAGVMSGVAIRLAFDLDHIRHHPDVARPPPPSISTPHQRRGGVSEVGRWQGVGGRG